MHQKKFLKSLRFSIIAALVFSALFAFANTPSTASALSGSQFRAGQIISDQLFYNGSSMNASQIQSFLNSKVPTCDTNGVKPYGGTTRAAYGKSRGYPPPYICLKNYTQSTPSLSATAQCGAYNGGTKSAARIIDDVARACKVSQKVLIVLLEKEQSLVTDDWPWSIQYRSATGYGCPDTSACDSLYYGFFNQVYNAARQYNLYKQFPEDYNHLPGRTQAVRYHPSASCGSKTVTITNYSTAGLYNFTPYTPNQAALNNLYGTGNSCSAYGNRNFWRLHNDWFGSTISEPKTKVITGDWNGDGKDSIAIKVNNKYLIENDDSNNQFSSSLVWGNSSDRAFSGDWDDDGRDELGLRRGNTYFLRDIPSALTWGNKSDQSFVGDWNGDGSDEIGLKRGNTYYLRGVSAPLVWGNSSDQVIVGDWNDDGSDEIGLKRGNIYYLRGVSAPLVWGNKSDRVIVGDWNGDGSDEIGLKRGNTYYLRGISSPLTWGNGSDQTFAGDWNGDDKDSIGLNRYFTIFLRYTTAPSSPGTHNSYSLF